MGQFLENLIKTGFSNSLAACCEPALTKKVSLQLNPYSSFTITTHFFFSPYAGCSVLPNIDLRGGYGRSPPLRKQRFLTTRAMSQNIHRHRIYTDTPSQVRIYTDTLRALSGRAVIHKNPDFEEKLLKMWHLLKCGVRTYVVCVRRLYSTASLGCGRSMSTVAFRHIETMFLTQPKKKRLCF